MDRRSLYDDDVYAWAQQQAEVLRRLAETGRDLPNELDLENVAEEIEDVGRSELHRVESLIRLILLHLIKAASASDGRPGQHWRGEVKIWRIDLRKNLTASMRRKIDIEEAWEVAATKAEVDLAKEGDQVAPGLPRPPRSPSTTWPARASISSGRSSGSRRAVDLTPVIPDSSPSCVHRGARFARMRCSVRRCMLRRRAVSDTLRPQSS